MRLRAVCRCAGIGREDHLADVFVMGVAGLDLLRDGVHVAEAAFELVGPRGMVALASRITLPTSS